MSTDVQMYRSPHPWDRKYRGFTLAMILSVGACHIQPSDRQNLRSSPFGSIATRQRLLSSITARVSVS